jgi:ABC-2 type transport system ATP-binding protein
MESKEVVLQTTNLSKRYGRGSTSPLALDDLSLSVRRGEIFGYLGPNGAGKTTTIRILLDLIRPTLGSAAIFGLDAQGHSLEIRQRVGFLPGELALWSGEKAINVIRYFGRMRGGLDMNYVRELCDRFQFDLSKRVRQYSTGNKRKLGLILAVMNRPELLILDEPTSGLDPLMQQEFNRLMREFRADGHTVFLSSHLLSEVQAICDRVAILRAGQLKAVEHVETLTHADFRWVTVKVKDVSAVAHRLDRVPGISQVTTRHESVTVRLQGDFDPLLRAFDDQYVIDLRVKEPTLEEIFLEFYEDGSAHNPSGGTAAPSERRVAAMKERV